MIMTTRLTALLLGLLALGLFVGSIAADSQSGNSPPDSVSSVSLSRADGTVTASWNAPAGATHYHVTYNDGSGWHAPVDDHRNVRTTSISFSADNAKTVVVGVRAGNEHGWSGWVNSAASGPYTPPNSPPANPPAAVASVTLTRADGTATASWDAPSGATKYHITYNDGSGWQAPVDDHRNVQTTSITFSVDNAKTVVVGVRAGNEHGWSGWVNSAASGPYTPPPPPTPPGIIVQDAGGAALSAISVPEGGEASYQVVLAAAPTEAVEVCIGLAVRDNDDPDISFKGEAVDEVSLKLTFTPTNWDTAQTVTLVAAFDADGLNGARDITHDAREYYSGKVDITATEIDTIASPAAPSGLTATAGDGSLTLTWDDPSDASTTHYEYNVNHNATGTGNFSGWSAWTPIPGSDASTTSHTFSGLSNGKEYRYHLRAVNAAGAGAGAPNAAPWFVKAVPAVPVPVAPDNFAVDPGNGYLDLSWDAVENATAYDIRAKESGVNDWHSVADKVTGTSYRYTTDKTIDHVAVRAVNADVVGPWTELSRLPDHGWLNTVQSSGAGGASIASASAQNQLAAPSWGTITRGYDAGRRSGRIDVNWTGDSNATGYNLVCAVAGSTPASTGWNWHPCGWVDATTDTVKFTTVPANVSQPVGIVSYKRGAESQLPPGIIPLEGGQEPHTIPRSYAVSIRAVSATPSEASAWVATASIKPLNPQLSNLTYTRGNGQIALSWTPNPWTTGYEIDCAVLGSAYTRCATLTNQDHSASQHSVTVSTWTAGGTNYAIDNSSIYDIRICSTNTWGNGCYLAPLVNPNPALTASNLGTTTATLTIAHHSGNWYYQHTNTGATCDGPVSGTSKDLTGLTANTAYTYSAYSDSACSTLLAAATGFTTLSSVSNLTSTKHGTFESSIHSGQSAAVAFTTGSNASGYVLKSVTVPLKQASGTSGVFFQLRAMKGTGQYTSTSQAADASLATLSTATPTTSTYTDTTVTCSGSGCSLSPDTTYFIVASNIDVGTGYSWAVSTSETETAQPSGNGWSVEFGHYKQGGRNSIWGSYSDWNPAEIVFATNPSLTASSVTATTATLTIANHAGDWYYKHTNTGATCDGPVSGTTKNLTGLTASTSYTYSAYSDSGCTSGNLLASASEFTTLAIVSVSTLSGGDNGVVNVGGGSPTQRVAQAFTTGSNTGGYTLSSIAIAFRATVGSPTDLEVTLHAASGSNPNTGTTLATLSGGNPSTAGSYTYTCSSGCDLSASTTYFVYIKAPNSANGSHYLATFTSSDETLTPSGNGWSMADKGRLQYVGVGWFESGSHYRIAVTATTK